MARNNYEYEKRQKDIARKKKQEEKRLKRFNKSQVKDDQDSVIINEETENQD